MSHIKEPLLERVAHEMATASCLFRSLSGPLCYVRRHITVNSYVLGALLNKIFPPFLSRSFSGPLPYV